MPKVERRVGLDQPNRHPNDLAYRAPFHHEVMLEAACPPNPRAVVEDEETQLATDGLWRSRLKALKHTRQHSNLNDGGWGD